jgi:hypothetical protein
LDQSTRLSRTAGDRLAVAGTFAQSIFLRDMLDAARI